MGKKKSKKKNSGSATQETSLSTIPNFVIGGNNTNEGLWVDPARVRFQHSRIRPFFSGCGRSVIGTLEDIRQGKLLPSDLPPIQVIVGQKNKNNDNINNDKKDNFDNGPWYFSLNNRRLWVLKRCREEGLLLSTNNQIYVRVRIPKSEQELARYSVENCALEAKIIQEKPKQQSKASSSSSSSSSSNAKVKQKDVDLMNDEFNEDFSNMKLSMSEVDVENKNHDNDDGDGDDDDESSDEFQTHSNRFSAFL